MSEPPSDRFEFWTRFVCAFVFFGIVLAFVSLYLLIDYELVPVIGTMVILNGLISWYAACHGDSAWVKISEVIGSFMWWT